MRISKRLEALYEAVNPGESVADIGTDHGYVPILLLQNGISEKVILSDISTGSLAKAEENFRQMGIEIPYRGRSFLHRARRSGCVDYRRPGRTNHPSNFDG